VIANHLNFPKRIEKEYTQSNVPLFKASSFISFFPKSDEKLVGVMPPMGILAS
jgi:hypothetical protein